MSAPKRTPFEKFVDSYTAAEAGRAGFETGIPMRDGVELAADVYLPPESQLPTPAIVQVTPYDKTGGLVGPAEAKFYADRGYAYVIADCRGRGKSEGEWRPFINDPKDTHDVIEWAARQKWCTGKVGTMGVSYGGWIQWAAASERPPHLTCMVSTSAAGRWQQEIPFTNGVFQLYFGWWVFLVRRRISEVHGLGLHDWDHVLRLLPLEKVGEFINPAGRVWRDLVDEDTLGEHWRSIRFDGRYSQIDVPCLHFTGWYDLEDLLGEFHHYEQMMAKSPARDRQRLIVGPWSHVKARRPHHTYADVHFGPDAALDTDALHLRWFDHWLKGIDNGIMSELPPVRVYEPGTNVWRDSARWPLSDREATLHLRFDGREGRLSVQTPGRRDAPRSFRYNPEDPAPTQLDVRQYPLEDVPLLQNPVEARPDVIAYTSEPLTEKVVVSGWPHLRLFADSDCDDTDWHVKVTDVDAQGQSRKVTQGCLRASFRESLEKPTPLTPGKVTEFDVELWPTHHAFLPGHRIRVTITSSDFPWFARSMNRFGPIHLLGDPRVATNTVYHAPAYPSRIVLPVEGAPKW